MKGLDAFYENVDFIGNNIKQKNKKSIFFEF